jgi:hypothetical protein
MARTVLARRFSNSEHYRTDVPGQYEAVFYASDRWTFDASDGQYKTFVEREIDGDLEVGSAAIKVRGARSQAVFLIGPMRKRLVVQQFNGATWDDLPLTLAGHSVVSKTDDLAVWRWRYELPDGTDVFGARLTVTPGRSKWDYAFRAPVAGQYRIRIDVQVVGATSVETFHIRGGSENYLAYWTTPEGKYAYNWRDMLAQVAGVQADVNGLSILSKMATLAQDEVVTLDPTLGPVTASWGADVDNTTKYPNDGTDYCGGFSTNVNRVANKFNLSGLIATDTVTQVGYSIQVASVTSAGALLWDMGCYGTNGQDDPEADSAATMYSRCIPGNVYLNDITDYRTTGAKSNADLGAQAVADVQAAISVGRFSLAWRETTDTTSEANCDFAEYTEADPPTLTVTYTNPPRSHGFRLQQHAVSEGTDFAAEHDVRSWF